MKDLLKIIVDHVKEVMVFLTPKIPVKLIRCWWQVANLVAKRLGVRKPTAKRSDEPWWKRRIKQKIMQLRKDMSRLERVSD